MFAASSRSIRLVGLAANASKTHCKSTNNNIRQHVRRESTTPSAAPVRQSVTKEQRSARRAARKERANAFISTGAAESAAEGTSESAAAALGKQGQKASSGPMFDASRLGWYAAVLIPTAFIGWGIVDDESPPAQLAKMVGLTDQIEEFTKPARAKLLPDWSALPNVPKDIPAPPVLVVDLESTLVCSSWDRKYGWRHAKRPGVDKFLSTLAQYYEIIIWTPSPDSLALPVLESINEKGYVMHFLFRDSTNYHKGVHCKDLSWLNRPLRKIVALDDDPGALQFQPENLIPVKPYDDPNDREDDTLERITPLLVEISREGYDNIPELLNQFRGMDADEIASEHERRVNNLRVERERVNQSGLGSFASRSSLPPPELPPNLAGSGSGQQQLTAKDLVGSAPPTEASDSGAIGWLQRRQKQQKEQAEEKFQLWNEVMVKKRADKQKQMEEAQQAAQQ